MRGEHDAHVPFGHELHEPLEELPAGQRVEAGHRLVEDEQLGPLGHRQGEGELRPLAARERAGRLVEIEVELGDALPGQCVVPAGVHLPAEAEVVRNGEAGVGRGVLGDEAHARQLGGVGGRWATEHGHGAGGRCEQADGQVQQRGLACSVGADESDDVAGGDLKVAVLERPAPAVPLAQTLGIDDPAHAMSSWAVERKESRNSASMLSSSSPARRALTIQRCSA